MDFVDNPDPAIAVILDLAKRYNTGWVYSKGPAEYSAKAMKDLGIVSDGPDKPWGTST